MADDNKQAACDGLVRRVWVMARYEGTACLMVQVALDVLGGVTEHDVERLAGFAVDQVATETRHQDERKRKLIEKLNSPKEAAKRRAAIEAGTYMPSDTTVPLYRAATLLLEGMQRSKAKPPIPAHKSQLFAALGLALLDAGLRAPSDVPLGAVTWKLGGRERLLLDAAECIHAWQYAIDDGRQARKEWRIALKDFIRKLHRENLVLPPAKEASRLFLIEHPRYEGDAANSSSFATTYSTLKKQVLKKQATA